MLKNLITRTLSGFLFVAVIISSVLFNQYGFASIFALIAGWAVYEFHTMTNQQEIQVSKPISVIAAILLFSCSFISASGITTFPVFSIYGFFVVLTLIYELYKQKGNPLHNWTYFIFGQMFVALPFSLLNYILFIDGWQPIVLLSVFVTIWVNDSGAYLFGISLGKHRLFERISPKKSWEGFIGGALATLGSGYVFSLYIPQLNLLEWLIFSEIIVVFGTFGDLIESLMKRTVNIKDSGNVLPGHGGLLDRFDSMILAAPVIFIYLSLLFHHV